MRLTLITKPECHLCDAARAVVDSVLVQVAAEAPVDLEEKSILDDAALYDRYWDEIPVLLIDGRVHAVWRVEPDRLLMALRAASG